MSDNKEDLWQVKYDPMVAWFYDNDTTLRSPANIASCRLCGARVSGSTGRMGWHLEAVHELEIKKRSHGRERVLFLESAKLLEATPEEVAMYLKARVAPLVKAYVPRVGGEALGYLEGQVAIGSNVMAKIETLISLGCSPAQIAEQIGGKENL